MQSSLAILAVDILLNRVPGLKRGSIRRREIAMKLVTVLAVLLALTLVSSAFAGANYGVAIGAVHVLPHASRTCAKSFPTITGCEDIFTTEPGPDVDAFPVFFDLVEYQGFDYGMQWPGMYSAAFTSCSDLAIGTIQYPGDGISHAWYVCQPGPVAITGWAWIFDYGLISIVPHPSAGGINVGDCLGEIDQICTPFSAGIGGYIGDDPCGLPSGAESASWSSIKSLFR
jgi:hypothetical protein